VAFFIKNNSKNQDLSKIGILMHISYFWKQIEEK
jgi:hypothetical protein